jgi:hypothetical protein
MSLSEEGFFNSCKVLIFLMAGGATREGCPCKTEMVSSTLI